MNDITWDELVALGKQYIELDLELSSLEFNAPTMPDSPETISSGDEYQTYLDSIKQYETAREEHSKIAKQVQLKFKEIAVKLNSVYPHRIWIDVGLYKIFVDPLQHARKIRYVPVSNPDIPF